MKKLTTLLLAGALLLTPQFAHAADNDINIKLQLNNESLTINGVDMKVEKPYLSNETTLVPLRVITTAFGAVLNWDSATKSIHLKYGAHAITLTIGSKTAVVDDQTLDLPAPPELANGTTMVPIRFISENFGAKVSYDAATSQITITGSKQETTPDNDLNSDLGKTKLGNSFYGWSMNYPSGLEKQSISFKEDGAAFTDTNGEYRFSVYVEELEDSLSQDALLKKLNASVTSSETVLDKKYVRQGSGGYARIVSKNSEGKYYEGRGYVKGDYYYQIILTVNKEENYKNKAKNQAYTDLLDSFKTEFDKKDPAIKDISTVKDGYRTYVNKDFGFTMKLPSEWNDASSSSSLDFYDEKTDAALSIRVTSVEDKDTLAAWVDRETAQITSYYTSDNVKIDKPVDMTVSGEPAKLLKYSSRTGDTWTNFYGLYVFKDGHKFEIDFVQNKTAVDAKLFKAITDSFKFEGEATVGYIDDDRDFIDRDKTSTVTRKSQHFSIDIPDFWYPYEDEDSKDMLEYSFVGGLLLVFNNEDQSYDNIVQNDNKVLDEARKRKNFNIVMNGSDTIGGLNASKLVYENDADNGGRLRTFVYHVKSGDNVYTIIASMYQAVMTDANVQRLDKVIHSLKPLQ
ncbi:copper amine oxidase N-terminal domain-containing protein [Paenibacillus athensensis]|uniref:Copper amine oxidase-like N-terminal domain-containing protein n=1 Tax=Paenibacillus athensensis TaxID=1967502 RepID=A0A4Y8Q3C5_9BACL|nr:stalk domain-containing protein [Paenibacillus athensensis]MCD1258710.1 copper amine oxidase N-terminal domain-containing protein [Paenibacillus athensensis]